MQALWIENNNVSLRNLDEPAEVEKSVVLEVQLAGICGTDLELMRGYYEFRGIPGHEFVAKVVSGPKVMVGRRVVVDINFGCGECSQCKSGLHNHCQHRKVLGIKNHPGAFAEQVVVPGTNLLAVPDALDDRTAVFIEPLAAAMEITEQIQFPENARVLIIGAGRLGRLISLVLQKIVSDLSICIRSEVRDKQFDSSLRIVRPEDVETEYDYVVECSGQSSGFELALTAVKPRGCLIVKSTYASKLTLDMSSIVVNEVRLLGSRCGPMRKAIDSLLKAEIDLSTLKIREYSLVDYKLAFEAARNPDIDKVMFRPCDKL
ncbi:MAG: alcohol dehydrogenase catalytic domain-containing protein [bacterium]|nr:alcohol dehydrogenase [Gammaproteobacteria bacterium]HIL98979.1 alcohol dehydrogenase [Pseudomonadales bacterium]